MPRDVIDLTKGELRMAKAHQIGGDSKMIEAILQHVANGGSLKQLSDMWDFDYACMRRILNQDHKPEWEAAKDARLEYKQEAIVNELEAIAYSDPTSIFKNDGSLKPIDEWPEQVRKSVAGIDVAETTTDDGETTTIIKKIKLNPKIKALEIMAKEAELLHEKVDVNVKHIDVNEAMEKAKGRLIEGEDKNVDDSTERLPARDYRPDQTINVTAQEADISPATNGRGENPDGNIHAGKRAEQGHEGVLDSTPERADGASSGSPERTES